MTDSPHSEPRPATGPRVTVLEHSPEAPLGRVGTWLTEAGARVDIRRLHAGDEVPTLAGSGDALIVLGGLMDAYADERAPWLPATRALLVEAVDEGLPTLGICLGHQLLAVALGGRVDVAAAAGPERGATVVTWAAGAAGDPVLGPTVRAGEEAGRGTAVGGDRGDGGDGGDGAEVGRGAMAGDGWAAGATGGRAWVYEFHNDAVSAAPPGAEVLAWSGTYPVQAFRAGSALGVQFHPEVGPEGLRRWAVTTPGMDEAAAEAIEFEARRVDETAAAVGRGLVEGLLAQVRGR